MPIKKFGYAFLSCLMLIQTLVLALTPNIVLATEPSAVFEQTDTEARLDLVISAVQITGGTGKTQEDFIELYNPSNQDIDLNGYRLVKRTAASTSDALIVAWTSSAIVKAHHFYLWANSNFVSISISPDIISTATLAADNGIALRFGNNNEGEIIDSLAWGSTANGFGTIAINNPGANESVFLSDPFAENREYLVQASAARNSSIELSPPNPPVEDPSEDSEVIEEVEDNAYPEEDNDPAQSQAQPEIIITEILPNPLGSDTGMEKIELYNAGFELAELEGFKIDDISEDQPFSSNAYTFDNLQIDPGSYFVLTVPEGGFSLNNTGGETVSLFTNDHVLVNSVNYEESSPEAKSLVLYENEWYWGISSFGQKNSPPSADDENNSEVEDSEEESDKDYDNSELQISEVFPQPKSGGTEFVEIYNSGKQTSQLSMVTIIIGERKKTLKEQEVEPGEYYVLEADELPIQLRNSGQAMKILEGIKILDSVNYPAATADASYSKFEDGFAWTTKITKGKENILEIPEATKQEVLEKAKTIAKKASSSTSKTSSKSNTAAKGSPSKTTTKQPATAKTDGAMAKQGATNEKPTEVISPASAAPSKSSVGKIIAMGAAAVTAGIIALYKLVFTGSAE